MSRNHPLRRSHRHAPLRRDLTRSTVRGFGTGLGLLAAVAGVRVAGSAAVRLIDAVADRWQRHRRSRGRG